MDIQRKKGILDVCVLSVLRNGPSYGYLIVRAVSECIEISESTLYPILKRLESSGCLTTYKKEYSGRLRKYYQITQTGITKIQEYLEEWDEMKKVYTFIANHQSEVEA